MVSLLLSFRLLVCWQRLERLENVIDSFNHDFREPLAQLGFLVVSEIAQDVEFVDGSYDSTCSGKIELDV